MTRLTETRPYSLRPPIANEEERAQFQRRLALISKVVFLVGVGYWSFSIASIAIFMPAHVIHMFTTRSAQVFLGTVAFALTVWLGTRKGTWSSALLGAMDAALVLGLCTGWTISIGLETMSDAPPEYV